MKYVLVMIISLWVVSSCQKNLARYKPEFRPYAMEIHQRVRSIEPFVLTQADAMITQYWQKTDYLSCNLCRLEEPYFQPLRTFLEEHEETIDRILERGISKDFDQEDNLLIFQYYVIHHLPDIHVRIMEYFDIDLKTTPEYKQYSGDMVIWVRFYLEGT